MYKTMSEIRNKTDFATQVKDKTLSVKPCELCGREVGVRDVRQRPILCAFCLQKQSALSRYKNFQHGKLTPDERTRILTDKTTRRGPFGPKKA